MSMHQFGNTWIEVKAIVSVQIVYKRGYSKEGLAVEIETDEVQSVSVCLALGTVLNIAHQKSAQEFAEWWVEENAA